jgi:hypothetical protein
MYSVSKDEVIRLWYQEPKFGFFIARQLSRYGSESVDAMVQLAGRRKHEPSADAGSTAKVLPLKERLRPARTTGPGAGEMHLGKVRCDRTTHAELQLAVAQDDCGAVGDKGRVIRSGRKTMHVPYFPRCFLAVVTGFAAFATWSTALSAPVLHFGDVTVEVSSTFSGFSLFEEVAGSTVAPNDPQIFTTLVQPPLFPRFPTSPSALTRGFVSATFTALKLGGVGISGIALNRCSGEGFAIYDQTVFNDSAEPPVARPHDG